MKKTTIFILVITITSLFTACDLEQKPKIGDVKSTVTYGSIKLNTNITGTLYINEEEIGEVKKHTEFPVNNIVRGKCNLEIKKGKEILWKKTVIIIENDTINVSTEKNNNEPTKKKYIVDTDTINKDKKNTNNERFDKLGSFSDNRDGKIYKYVKIGNQVWMAENLAYLPKVCSIEQYECGYWVYDYKGNNVSEAKTTENYKKHGVLYNWRTAKRSCPEGWHLPTDYEWTILEIELGMDKEREEETGFRGNLATKLKAKTGWRNNGTNESGFTALPSGSCGDNEFSFKEFGGWWWSNSDYGRNINDHGHKITKYPLTKDNGYSIRCLHD